MVINYFAYGSNMDIDDLNAWCSKQGYSSISFHKVTLAKLNGYKLSFNYFSTSRNAGAANIMRSIVENVYGLLIEMNQSDLQTIRKKEGYPNSYNEITVAVETFEGIIINGVKTYKVRKQKECTDYQPPSKYYLNLIISNAQKYSFPKHYIEYLKSLKTKD